MNKYTLRLFFLLSILLNLFYCIDYINQPTYTLGKLRQDVTVKGFFDGQYDNKVLFNLPKGMVVRDAAPQGLAAVGVFEPNRIEFTIIVSEDFVDYSKSFDLTPSDALYSYH